MLSWLIALFLLISLGYLLLSYALRWYEVTNDPDYQAKYGDRTLSKTGWHGILLFTQEYLLLVIHMLFYIADYLLWPYYYLRGERNGLISDKRYNNTYNKTGRNPVILLHGYMMRGGTLWCLRHRLRKDGWHVWLFNYWPPMSTISHFAEQLQRAVEWVISQTGHDKVDLVGHSMGGLIIRYYLTYLGGEKRVQRAVSLASPHCGTKLWSFSLGKCGSQMRPDSKFLQELNSARLAETSFTSIYSDFDELIIPNGNSHLTIPGAKNKKIPGLGHVGIIFSKPVYNLIKQVLQAH